MTKNNFFAKLRNDRGTRAIAITVTVLLLLLTAIIVTTVIANRKMNETPELPDISDSEPAAVTDPDVEQGEEEPDPTLGNPATENTETDAAPTHFILPVSGVLMKGHDASIQVFSDTMQDYRVHLGIDIGTVAGASVAAMADGVISQIWEDVSMGQCVAIKHSGDVYTIYKNLSNELPEQIAVGVCVKAGDVIGTVGESAMVEIAENPHLHLEMTVNGLQVDPTEYLDESAIATLHEDTNYEDES